MCVYVYRIRRRGGMNSTKSELNKKKKKKIDKQNIYIKSQVSADTLERDGRFFFFCYC